MPDLDSVEAIPIGGIIQWNGTIASIPSGFALCDGGGSRPDLRSRFIRGTPAGTDPGETGGSDTVSLIGDELPEHNHGSGQSAHTHTTKKGNGGGGKSHGKNAPGNAIGFLSAVSGITLGNVGSGSPHENRPSYFELAFIIKE